MEQLRALAALPRLAVLNLYGTTWTEDAVSVGPTLLAANLPHLRILNAPHEALVRTTLHARVLFLYADQLADEVDSMIVSSTCSALPCILVQIAANMGRGMICTASIMPIMPIISAKMGQLLWELPSILSCDLALGCRVEHRSMR